MTKEERKEYQKKYRQSLKGKISIKKYGQSPKGKESHKKYEQSDKGKKNHKRYGQSIKGKISSRKAQKQYRQSEEGKAYYERYQKEYKQYHKEQAKEYQKKCYQSPKGKRSRIESNARRRQLGFIPLNEPFEGCEGHHIDIERVIYIPKKLHRSIWHSISSGVGMDKINKLAFDYLRIENEVIKSRN